MIRSKRMRPIGSALPGALSELLRSAPLSPGKISFAWRAAVGPAIDRVTAATLNGGVLVVQADDRHWAREVTRSSGLILNRLQNLLGPDLVSRIEVRVRA